MKTRSINTKIWKDGWFSNLMPRDKLLFIYLITNPYIDLTGIYECTDKLIMYDTGLSPDELRRSKIALKGKVLFSNDWIIIKNSDKYDTFAGGKLIKAKENQMALIPPKIHKIATKFREVDTPSIGYHRVSIPYDTPNSNSNSNSNNNNIRGIVKGGIMIPEFLEYIKTFNQKYKTEYRPTKAMEELYKARLVTFTHAEILQSFEIMFKDPFYRGDNDRNWKATPEFLISKDEKVDKFLNLKEGGKGEKIDLNTYEF